MDGVIGGETAKGNKAPEVHRRTNKGGGRLASTGNVDSECDQAAASALAESHLHQEERKSLLSLMGESIGHSLRNVLSAAANVRVEGEEQPRNEKLPKKEQQKRHARVRHQKQKKKK